MRDPAFRAFQRQFFRSLQDRPLDLSIERDEALYEPLYGDLHDPVYRLFDIIDFSDRESVQLVAGFRGTGKTTEFSRLERELWAADFRVIRVDLDDYLDMASPVDVADFLLILCGAISDRLADERLLGPGLSGLPGFWDRAREFLKHEVALADVKGRLAGDNLRIGLRGDQGLRQRIRYAVSGQLPKLVDEVREWHEGVLAALGARHDGDPRLVVIVDSLEHLRGTGENFENVHRSVEELFITHGSDLQLPNTHMVLNVPPFLALKAERLQAAFVNGAVEGWPAAQVRRRDGSVHPEIVDRLVRLVERRGDWSRVLPDRDALVRLVLASGGYIRDLLTMLVEAIHLAGRGVRPDAADRVIAVVQRGYLPLYSDEVTVLRKIADARSLGAVAWNEREYLVRFLDSHLVLRYLDDLYWYDVHPLVRDQVTDAGPPR